MGSQNRKGSTLKCQATDPDIDWSVCSRDVWKADGGTTCIFHCGHSTLNEFKEHFMAELKRVNETDSIECFDGRCFILPENLELENITFTKPVDFNSAKFGNNISFKNVRFNKEANLQEAEFGNKIIFDKVEFCSRAIFTSTKFGHLASFKNTKFGHNTVFENAEFGESASFGKSKFGQLASFKGAKFSNYASFPYAKFGDKSTFYKAIFGDSVTFKGTIFVKNVIFSQAQFGLNVNFSQAEFDKSASFQQTMFGDDAYFSHTQFSNSASFLKAQFGGGANFSDTRFVRDTSFEETRFGNRATFSRTDFGDSVSFLKTIFGREVYFNEAKFGDKAYFYETSIGSRSKFSNAQFKRELILAKITSLGAKVDDAIDFTNVTFEEPQHVRIQGVDLRSFAMLKTNIQEVTFLDCIWRKTNNRQFAVFDEVYQKKMKNHSEDFMVKPTLGEIEQLYLRLQANFEINKYALGAGDFYIGAMEMRRRQIAEGGRTSWRWLRQNFLSLEAWYRYVSLYGQRWARTLLWMQFAIILFAMFFLISGFDYPKEAKLNASKNYVNYDLGEKWSLPQLANDYLKALDVSFLTFTFQRNLPYVLYPASRVLAAVESALSAMLVALFLLAIRRRFKL